MRNLTLSICLMFLTFGALCQITERKINDNNKEPELQNILSTPYDSLSGIEVQPRFENYYKYIGQRLFLVNKLRDIFLLTPKPKLSYFLGKKPLRPYNIGGYYESLATFVYKPNLTNVSGYGEDFKIASHGDEIYNQYYEVINILPDANNVLKGLNIKDYSYNENVLKNYQKSIVANGDCYEDKSRTNIVRTKYPMFILKNESSGDTIYCSNAAPFIVNGNFEKLKKVYTNIVFVNQKNDYTDLDINSGKEIMISSESKWICKEISLMEQISKNFDPRGKSIYLILKSQNAENVEIAINTKKILNNEPIENKRWITDNEFATILKKLNQTQIAESKRKENELNEQKLRIQKENEADAVAKAKFKKECIAKYGQNYGTLISQRKVEIGMGAELCQLSWGKPTSIKKITDESGITEIWLYDKSFYVFLNKTNLLYFKNGILKRVEEQM